MSLRKKWNAAFRWLGQSFGAQIFLLFVFVLFVACGDDLFDFIGLGVNFIVDCVVVGIDFGLFFAPPTAAELQAVRIAWAQRDVSAQGIETLLETPLTLGTTPVTLRIIAHQVAGICHIGVVFAPGGPS